MEIRARMAGVQARLHLGFAVQLKHYEYNGRLLYTHTDIAETPFHFLAEQLQIPCSGIESYDFGGRSGKRLGTKQSSSSVRLKTNEHSCIILQEAA